MADSVAVIARPAATLLSLTSSFAGDRTPTVITVVAALLERLVAWNHRHFGGGGGGARGRPTVFHGLRAPAISIEKYLERIFKYANCSPACFVVAYAYIDRFVHQRPDVLVTALNVHRLLITSVMAAAKFLDDACYNNAYYAKVGGVSTREMNHLEMEFLFTLDFRLQVTVSAFESYCAHLEREVVCCSAALVMATCCAHCVHNLRCHDRQQSQSPPSDVEKPLSEQQQALMPARCICYAGV